MNDGSDEATCRGCGAMRSYRHQPGCPYEHPWPRDRVDNVQTQIEPIDGIADEDMDALAEQIGRSDDERPDAPVIESAVAEVERLREALTDAQRTAVLAAADWLERGAPIAAKWLRHDYLPSLTAMSDEDPTMVTAADYETHIRPHIASLEAEIERLRTLMTEAAKQDPVTCRKRIQAALDIT